MQTHLIIGGSGFIGRHVAVGLARAGHRVTVADRFAVPVPFPRDVADAIVFQPVDVTRIGECGAAWDALVADTDVVHHLAWSTIPASAHRDPLGDLDANVRSSLSLLDALKRRGGGRLVFASSGGTVYGRLRTIPVPEDHAAEPVTAYGVSKLMVEKYCGLYRHLHGVDCRVARISNPFGAGQDPHRGQGAATAFLHRALSGDPIVIWGDGSVVRDYLHISDTVRAFTTLALCPRERLGERWVFNIGSGTGISLNAIIECLESRLGRRLDVRFEQARPFDVPINVLDISAAREVLGWFPLLSFAEGLTATIQDLRAGREFARCLKETA